MFFASVLIAFSIVINLLNILYVSNREKYYYHNVENFSFWWYQKLSCILVTQTVACPGFILAGEEKKLGGAEKNSGGAESRPKGAKFCSAPPTKNSASSTEFDSAPGAEQARGGGGAERERGRNIL